MKEVLLALLFLLAGCAGTAAVLNRDPLRQAMTSGYFALALAALFLALDAPDVAIAEIAVGVILLPALVILTLAKAKEFRWHRGEVAAERDEEAIERDTAPRQGAEGGGS